MKGKDIVITGGCGYIGSALTRALAPYNSITIVDVVSCTSFPGITVIKKDIRTDIEEHFRNKDVVFHLAAHVTFPDSSRDNPKKDADINIGGTLNVLEACRTQDVPKVVIASSAAVYGVPTTIPVKEDDPLVPVTPYGLSKKVCEEYAQLYHDLYGIETVRLRLFNVYGLNQNPNAVLARFIRCIQQKTPITVFGDGSTTRDFIYITDVVKAYILAGKTPCTGAINVGTGRETSMRDLISILETVYKDITVVYVPEKSGSIPRSVADTQKAKKVLTFESTITVEEGIDLVTSGSQG